MAKQWGPADNAKLLSLLKQKKGGIDPKNISKDYVKGVIAKHFPHRTYGNLAQLYRSKLLNFNLAGTLSGARSFEKKRK